jgi:hypothetical protein
MRKEPTQNMASSTKQGEEVESKQKKLEPEGILSISSLKDDPFF